MMLPSEGKFPYKIIVTEHQEFQTKYTYEFYKNGQVDLTEYWKDKPVRSAKMHEDFAEGLIKMDQKLGFTSFQAQ